MLWCLFMAEIRNTFSNRFMLPTKFVHYSTYVCITIMCLISSWILLMTDVVLPQVPVCSNLSDIGTSFSSPECNKRQHSVSFTGNTLITLLSGHFCTFIHSFWCHQCYSGSCCLFQGWTNFVYIILLQNLLFWAVTDQQQVKYVYFHQG